MLAIVVIENGQKKIIPLTADAGAGNPVGTIIVVCSNQIPSNYLPLGTQFDTSLYPVLYALLGTDTTPTASALGLSTLTGGQYAIKATSGLSENAQDNVINTLNEQRSYSTTEHWTGKYWKDGKKIYSKTIDCGALPNATTKTIAHSISNLGRFTKVEAISTMANNNTLMLPYVSPSSLTAQVGFVVDATNIEIRSASDYSTYEFTDVTLEYTKTN